jgi:8-oxo-dGTP diphosphatase
MKDRVLVFYLKEGKVLLVKKSSEASISTGMWSGYGGEIMAGESPKRAAVRETEEGSGYKLIVYEENLIFRGKITFYINSNLMWKIHLFVCEKFSGEPRKTDIMSDPTWFDLLQISSLNMMLGDKLFIPIILEGDIIKDGWIVFEERFVGIKDYSLI